MSGKTEEKKHVYRVQYCNLNIYLGMYMYTTSSY